MKKKKVFADQKQELSTKSVEYSAAKDGGHIIL
jgi:hypothetical protein